MAETATDASAHLQLAAQDLPHAEVIWDYHNLGQSLEGVKADFIFALGSHDLRVAERAAELYLAGHAPHVLLSGGLGNFTEGVFKKPEARLFEEVALAKGVPAEAIIVEDRSTNTGENCRFSKAILAERGLSGTRFILVQKPYMERRTLATVRKQWPEIEAVAVTSPQLGLLEYPTPEISLNQVVHIMLGDLQRIREYPAKGFQIAMHIPDEVWGAWTALATAGYTDHLLKGTTIEPYACG